MDRLMMDIMNNKINDLKEEIFRIDQEFKEILDRIEEVIDSIE